MTTTHKADKSHGGRSAGVQKNTADRKQRHKDMIDSLFSQHAAKPSVDATQKETMLAEGVQKQRRKPSAQSKVRPYQLRQSP
jgi:hypothetical protein